MMFWDGGQLAFWQVATMWLGMIGFWAAVIWFGYYLVTAATYNSQTPDSRDGAREILDERFARGDIDTDEYRQCLDALTLGRPNKATVGGAK